MGSAQHDAGSDTDRRGVARDRQTEAYASQDADDAEPGWGRGGILPIHEPDWQTRVNRLVSAWMHARLAGVIRGGETMDYLARREEEVLDGRRPEFGDIQRDYDAALGDAALGDAGAGREGGVPMIEGGEMSRAGREALMAEMRGRRGLG